MKEKKYLKMKKEEIIQQIGNCIFDYIVQCYQMHACGFMAATEIEMIIKDVFINKDTYKEIVNIWENE